MEDQVVLLLDSSSTSRGPGGRPVKEPHTRPLYTIYTLYTMYKLYTHEQVVHHVHHVQLVQGRLKGRPFL
jgi:hypothetical protein